MNPLIGVDVDIKGATKGLELSARAIEIAIFSDAGRAKNRRLSASRSASTPAETPWPTR